MFFGPTATGGNVPNSGVCEDNVDVPDLFAYKLVESIKVGRFRNIALDSSGIRSEFRHRIVEFILPSPRDVNSRSPSDQYFRRC